MGMYVVDVVYEHRITVLVDAENEHEAKLLADEQSSRPNESALIDLIVTSLEE